MSEPSTPPVRDTHSHQLFSKVICHVIPQLLDIGKNPALSPRLHSDQTDCAVQEGATCMCTQDKMHVKSVLTPQGEQDVTPLQNRFRIAGFAFLCLVVLGFLELYTWQLTRLTRTPCDSIWQTTMVTESDARKGLFLNLSKPSNVVEAPALARNVAVDARNLAILFITFAPLGMISDPSIPGNMYHCGYTAIAYRVAEAVVVCYAAEKFAELAILHNQLTVYATRDENDKNSYVMPSFIIQLLRRIPLNTLWLNSHQEGSNCPDVENNVYMSTALQVTAHIFGVPFKPASITTYVMQRPIQFTDEMKHKDTFKPFAEKWTAKKNSMRALEFTMRQPDMLPTVRPPDDSPTRIAFTVHGISLPHITPPLDQIVPYDSQCDPALVVPSWKEMGLAVVCIMKPHLPSSSVLLPYMIPLVETNLPLFQTCVKGTRGSNTRWNLSREREKFPDSRSLPSIAFFSK